MVAAIETDWHADDDESVLTTCAVEHRVLMTNDVADFMTLTRRWQAEGRPHAGIVFTSDSSRPRSRNHIGRFIDDLHDLMTSAPAEGDWTDRIHWL